MWILLQSLARVRVLPDGPTIGSGSDAPGLYGEYQKAKVAAASVDRAQGGTAAAKTQATQDLKQLDKLLKDEVKLSHAGASDDVATVEAILEKLKKGGKMEAADLAMVREVVDHLKERLTNSMPPDLAAVITASPNAERALKTYAELKKMQQGDKHVPKRPDDDTIRLLTEAVAKPRAGDARGQAGVMGVDAAIRAAKALTQMSDADYQRTLDLLKGTDAHGEVLNPWSDSQLEKALLLKSIGANYKKPASKNDTKRNEEFFKQLETFAKDIHEVPRDELIRKTTLTGVEASGASLKQRYGQSCGPTTIQMLKGEQDPLYAWQLHQEGAVDSLGTAGQTAADQKEWLEKDGKGKAISREIINYTQTVVQAMAKHTTELSEDPPHRLEFGEAIGKRMDVLLAAKPVDDAKIDEIASLGAYMNNPNFKPSAEETKKIEAGIADLKAQGVDIDLEKVNTIRDQSRENQAKVANMETLRNYMRDPKLKPTEEQTKQIQAAIDFLKAKGVDIDLAKVESIRNEVKAHGLNVFKGGGVGMALEDSLDKRTGRSYTTEEVASPQAGNTLSPVKDKYLDRAARDLQDGKPVPLRIGYVDAKGKPDGSGHFMLMSDVRGDAPDREFLVSDPYSGKTQWVKEADLKSGAFAKDDPSATPPVAYGFNLGKAQVTDMYFPR